MGRVTERKPTPGIRERSMGHCELRAYNAATRKQIVRTCLHPRQATSAGCRYPRSEERARPTGVLHPLRSESVDAEGGSSWELEDEPRLPVSSSERDESSKRPSRLLEIAHLSSPSTAQSTMNSSNAPARISRFLYKYRQCFSNAEEDSILVVAVGAPWT
jgi:hypothetical protein